MFTLRWSGSAHASSSIFPTHLQIFILALLLCSGSAWSVELDTDLDQLSDEAEASRVRDHSFRAHEIQFTDPACDLPSACAIAGPGPDLPDSVALADLDGDGDPDLLASWSGWLAPGGIYWYRNRLSEPSRNFSLETKLASDSIQRRLDLFMSDLDGDGDLDLISHFQAHGYEYQVAWYENRLDAPEADFSPSRLIAAFAPGSGFSIPDVALVDLDADGDDDLVWAGANLFWSENRIDEASQDFGAAVALNPFGGDSFFDFNSIVIADLDHDGDRDLLHFTSADCRILWHENRLEEASNDFAAAQTIVSGVDGLRLSGLLDVDSDGYPEIFGSTCSAPPFGIGDPIEVYVLPNELSAQGGGFGSPELSSIPGFRGPVRLQGLDLDGDHDQDFISQPFDGLDFTTIVAFENKFPESADQFPVLDLGGIQTPATPLRFVDLDLDGDLDFVVSARDSDSGAAGLIWSENPGTDPLDPDSDGDGLLDGEEVAALTDPNDPFDPVPEPSPPLASWAVLVTTACLRQRKRRR